MVGLIQQVLAPSRLLPLYFAGAIIASTLLPVASAASFARDARLFERANDPNVIFDNSTGATEVWSPVTGQQIPQGSDSDGSGSGFSLPAILWIACCFVFGVPLMLAGIRGWRFTTGAALAIAAALCSWAVIVNKLDAIGISDIALTIFVLALSFLGFTVGLLQLGRLAGILVLGVLGGLSFTIRIVLLRKGLLVNGDATFFVNWLLIGVSGLAGAILVIFRQRAGILLGCASAGTFLCVLGIDLVMNKQSGMSCGLRYLFDRNTYHAADVLLTGYNPPLTTIIMLAISIALTPAFGYAQHRLFPHPFNRVYQPDVESRSIAEVPVVPEEAETKPISPETSRSSSDSSTPPSSPNTVETIDCIKEAPI
ncbi:hypothetical protein BJ138DRAFT_1160371 [Hygrophoropsis aurantiaca]|uniref:Uncharacterized protein n=1 Tax=Hygrophoropsis aurantiaca TaxID=72124 RepID=A0ACB8A2H6_9AGAM|nr:hypothetical protein BJ138DRAFT_1160371 [Hygrophoropsis aurantiaca]